MPCLKNARRVSAALSVCLLALAACDDSHPNQTSGPPAAKPASVAPALKAVWTPDGDNVLTLQQAGIEYLRMVCLPKKGLIVIAPPLRPVGSEERMSLGAGDVVVTLVASFDASISPVVVRGDGPIDPDFLNAFAEGRKVALNYGSQNLGPYDGPPAEVAQPFVEACKKAAG